MIEYLIFALRNLGRKRMRTLLTVSGIMIGVASVILIGAIGKGGELAVSKELDSLGINGLEIHAKTTDTGNYAITIGDDDVVSCMKVGGVQSAMPLIMQSGVSVLRSLQKDAMVWGVGENAKDIISLDLLYGRAISKTDVRSHAKVCLLDSKYALAAYQRENICGKKVTLYMGKGTEEFTVKGIVNSESSLIYSIAGNYIPTFVYMPYTTAQDMRGYLGYDQIAVKVRSNKDIDQIGSRIMQLLNRSHGAGDNYAADNMFRQKEKLSNLLSIVTLIISAVGAISMVVAGLGIMTVMMVSVNERTREIGIKKAVGARKGTILLEFLYEAVAITLIGSLLGIGIGYLLSAVASHILHFSFSISPSTLFLSTGLAALIGILFGVYPAMKAANLKPVDALRQE
jgi:putative ABC transport system permease protein